MSRSLFEISEDMQALEELIEENENDLTDDQIETICKWAECNMDEFENKVDNYSALIRILEARAKIRKEEAKRLTDRSRVDENAAKRLKERLLFVFKSRDVGKLETKRFRVSVAKNGGVIPLVIDGVSVDDVPEKFKRVSYDFDKDEIRRALESGEEITGCSLGERGESIRIK